MSRHATLLRHVMHRATLAAVIAGAFVFAACTRDEARMADRSAVAPPMHYFDNLGTFSRAISSRNDDAQRWFDQGLRLAYGFNHQAAARSFEQATKADPDCAICYWGHALVLGPNINMPMPAEAVAPAYALSRKALALREDASPVEQALIDALAVRYAETATDDRKALDEAYADAMRDVVRKYPDDLDAKTLLAEALMDLSP